MKRGLIFALGATLLFAAPGHSEDSRNQAQTAAATPAPTLLGAADVETYRAIFAAQDAAQFGKADSLIAKLENKDLLGYVLQERYLAPKYTSKFGELETWLAQYGDHVNADRVQKLALRKKPRKAKAPDAPIPARWRGERFDAEALVDLQLASERGRRMLEQLRGLAREHKPEAAEAAIKSLVVAPDLPQNDLDRLHAYVAAAYLAQGLDEEALRMAGDLILRTSEIAAQAHWTAGLASYRLARFGASARHFEAVSNSRANPRTAAGGAFWAARAWMQAGQPERVVALFDRAAAQPTTFYGMLAARLLGRDAGLSFVEPTLDAASFTAIMQNPAARRAVALWQIGEHAAVERELGRALGEVAPELDPAFAALARGLGSSNIELRAAEMSAHRGVYLTSLYPVPTYSPQGGFQLDRAMLLAFARQESRFDADARSSAGARGLMQFMPATAVEVARDPTLAEENNDMLDDPAYSMSLGQDHLLRLLSRQNGNLLGLAAAYNAGPANLSRWMGNFEGKDDPLLFIESVPAAETRDYMKRVMMNWWMYRKRLGEPVEGLDETASGTWPTYHQTRAARPAR